MRDEELSFVVSLVVTFGVGVKRIANVMGNSGCSRICDAKVFGMDEGNGGGRYTSQGIVERIESLCGDHVNPFVVFTGGDPGLQLDFELVQACRRMYTAVETNGSIKLPTGIKWVCISPKPPMPLIVQPCDEVKVLSCFDPLPYAKLSHNRYISPVARGDPEFKKLEYEKSVKFVMDHPERKISIQQHKVLGIQ